MSKVQSTYLDYELASAARKLVEQVMAVNPGESVIITGDGRADTRVMEATAKAVHAAGAYPGVIRSAARPVDGELQAPVAAAGAAADVWIDFAVQSAMYTEAQALACSRGTRFGDFLGFDVDALVRMVGQVDYTALLGLGERLIELTPAEAAVEITTEAGTHLTLSNSETPAGQDGAFADRPGAWTGPAGLVTWTPNETTANGVIVVDGTLWPPDELGELRETVTLTVESGSITAIEGGRAADSLQGWIDSLDSADMRRIAHVSYGCHPGVAKFGENPGVNERMLGTIALGFGGWHGRPAPSHFDGVVLNPTVVLGGQRVEQNGRYVDPALQASCRALGVFGY